MKTIAVIINNKSGLHARPATQFVGEAMKYQSNIVLRNALKNEANGKSIMSVLALGVGAYAEIELQADGHDEEQAILNLKTMLEQLVAE